MKSRFYKIMAAIGAFFGLLLLVFRSSKSEVVTDVQLEENKKRLDEVKDKILDIENDKEATKEKIKETKSIIEDAKSKKTSTKDAIEKAKDFKDKYKE